MPRPRRESNKQVQSKRPPATTPEGREAQLIGLAVDLAEEQLRTGVASAQVITHYLKLGSTREQLEQERLRHEVALLETKKASLDAQERMDKVYEEVLNAMRTYSGAESLGLDDYEN